MFEVFRDALTNSIIRYLQANDFNCDLPYLNLPLDTQIAMTVMYPVYIENYACNHAWFGGDLDPFVRSFPDPIIQGAMVAALAHTAAIVARLSNIRAAANDDNLRLLAALDKIQTDCAAAGATARSREAESILAQEKINRASNYIVGVTEPLRVSIADRMLAVDLNAHFTQIPRATQVAMRAMYRCLVGGFVGDFNEFSVAIDGVMRKLPEYLSLAAAEKEKALKYLTSMSAKLNAVRRALIDENDKNIDSLDAVLLNIYSQNIPVAVVANNALKYVQPAYFDKAFADALKNSIQDCLRYPVNFNNHRTQIPNGTLAAMAVMYPIFIQRYRGEAEFFCEAIDQYIKHNHRYLDLLDNYRLEAALTHFVSMIQKLQVYRRCVKDDNCIVLAEVFQRIPQDHLDIEFIVNQQCTFIEQALDNVNYNYRIAKKNAQIDVAAQQADAHAEINVCSAQLEQQSQGLKQNVETLEQKFKFVQDMIAQALNACELGDLEPIQKLKNLNDNDAWAWFCNGQPLSLAQAHGHEAVAAYLVANQVKDVAQWEDVKEDVNKQDGWSCFDVAAGIKREDIVAYATKPEHAKDKKYREFLSAEIKATLLELVQYINKKTGAILAATPADEQKVIEAMYPDMGERREMCKLLREADYFKPENQNKQDIEAKIDAYCTSEDVYLKYIRGYYGSEQMFSFMAEFEGAKPTSMVDIVARMLNKKIVIHNADKLSATEFEGEGEVHIRYYHKREHFVGMRKAEVAQLNPELLANYKENLKAYAARNIANYNVQANKLIQQSLDSIQKDQAETVAILQQQRELVDEQHQLQLTYIDSHFAALTEQSLAQTKGEFVRDADKQRTAKAVAESKWRAEIKAAIEANKRELDAAKARAKRKKTQLLIALPVIVAASFYLGPVVASYLAPSLAAAATGTAAASSFITLSAVSSGVIGGGLSAAISGGDVLKSAIEGGALAFAGQQINAAVASLHRISRVAISAATLCTIRTVMHGGNLVNNVCFSAGGAILGEVYLPASNLAGQELLTQGQVLQLMFENTARVVISSVPALLMGKEDIPSMISSSIGVMGSVYASNAANEAINQDAAKQQQWLGKNKPVPNSKEVLFSNKGEQVDAPVKPAAEKTKQTAKKQQRNAKNKKPIQHDVGPVDAGGLPEYLKLEPTNQAVQQNIEQRKAFSLPSALPEATEDTYLGHVYSVGRGIEKARDSVTDSIIETAKHPIDTAEALMATVWDGLNAISEVTTGVVSDAARLRNSARGNAVNDKIDEFKAADGLKKTEMVSQLGATLILSTAAGGAVRSVAPMAIKVLPKPVRAPIIFSKKTFVENMSASSTLGSNGAQVGEALLKATSLQNPFGKYSSIQPQACAQLTWQQAARNAQAAADASFAPGSIGAAKVWTTKARIKTAQLPTEGKIRYVPPPGYKSSNPLPKNHETQGIRDKFGNLWVRGESRTLGECFEWDVQLSDLGRKKLGWASRDGKHVNVSLKGRITHE